MRRHVSRLVALALLVVLGCAGTGNDEVDAYTACTKEVRARIDGQVHLPPPAVLREATAKVGDETFTTTAYVMTPGERVDFVCTVKFVDATRYDLLELRLDE